MNYVQFIYMIRIGIKILKNNLYSDMNHNIKVFLTVHNHNMTAIRIAFVHELLHINKRDKTVIEI